ncbi:hypothetical protein Tco_0921425 [Tanacetum coccineum]
MCMVQKSSMPLNLSMDVSLRWFRYHSIVIDPRSLPKELIPLAWTCSTQISALREQKSDHDAYDNQLDQETYHTSLSKEFNNGAKWRSSCADDGQLVKLDQWCQVFKASVEEFENLSCQVGGAKDIFVTSVSRREGWKHLLAG